MKTLPSPTDVDSYIAAFPRDAQAVLERVRRLVRRALPGAVEMISYGMPAYRVDGRVVIYFAGWKAHCSLYPVSERLLAEVRSERRSQESGRPGQSEVTMSGKGTIRFPLSGRVPATLLAAIVKARAMEAARAARPVRAR